VGLAGGAGDGSSLGLEIVRTLVAEDLQGTCTLTPGAGGTQALIRLPRPDAT
jgi:signal transduction histidine kinase